MLGLICHFISNEFKRWAPRTNELNRTSNIRSHWQGRTKLFIFILCSWHLFTFYERELLQRIKRRSYRDQEVSRFTKAFDAAASSTTSLSLTRKNGIYNIHIYKYIMYTLTQTHTIRGKEKERGVSHVITTLGAQLVKLSCADPFTATTRRMMATRLCSNSSSYFTSQSFFLSRQSANCICDLLFLLSCW